MTNAFSTRRQNKDETEDLRRSIQHVLDEMASLRGLARGAEHRQYIDSFSALPALKTSRRTTTRHFAELDDEGCAIRRWDVEKTATTYYLDYLDKKG